MEGEGGAEQEGNGECELNDRVEDGSADEADSCGDESGLREIAGEEGGDGVEARGALLPEFDGGTVPEAEKEEVESEGEGVDGDGDAEGEDGGDGEFFREADAGGVDGEEVEGEGGEDGKGREDGKGAELGQGDEVGRSKDGQGKACLPSEGMAERLVRRGCVARIEEAVEEVDGPDAEAERPSVVVGDWLEVF